MPNNEFKNDQGEENKKKNNNKIYISLLIFILSLTAIIAAYATYQMQTITLASGIAIYAIILVGIAPSYFYILHRRQDGIPFIPLFSFGLAVTYGITTFLADITYLGQSPYKLYYLATLESFTLRAALSALSGVAAVIFAILVFRKIFGRSRGILRFAAPKNDSANYLRWMVWPPYILSLAATAFPALNQIPSIPQLYQPAALFSTSAILFLYLKGTWTKWEGRFAVTVAVPALIIVSVMQNARISLAALIILGLLSTYWAVYRHLPLRWLFIFALGLALAYPNIHVMRAIYLRSDAPQGVWERVIALPQIISEDLRMEKADMKHRADSDGDGLADQILKSRTVIALLRRISFFPLYDYVVQTVPSRTPHWGGETYKPIVTAMVPRVLWPDKPTETAGRKFALTFNFANKDGVTTINIPWLIESYLNFGLWGVPIAMGLIGMFLAFLNMIFNRPDMGPLETAVAVSILIPLTFPESNFSLMVGSIPTLTVFYLVYLWGGHWIWSRIFAPNRPQPTP